MSGMPWRVDAYVCLREAWNNVRRHVANVRVMVQEGSLRPQTVGHVEGSPGRYELSEHRPVGISPHVLEGLNMMTVFVETAGVSAQMDRTRKWDVPASFQ